MATNGTIVVNSTDKTELGQKVEDMYRDVVLNPPGEFHFGMGRVLEERLGC